ncbi:lamin tail domain-containing protein [Verrucomicrobiaceae bacterium 227]
MHTPYRYPLLAWLTFIPALSAQSLVSYWDFENDLLDSAPAGATGDDGTWVGTPSFTETSPLGEGLLLDGSNFVTVPASADVDGFIGDYSLTAWFRVDQWDRASQVILSKGEAPNYAVERDGLGSGLRFADGSGNPAGGSVNDGVWHHFAAVSEGGEISEIYIDGEPVGSGGAASVSDSGGLLGIGNIPGAANRGWKGAIDDVGIFHDHLNLFQTKAIYTLGRDAGLSYDLPEVVQLFGLHRAGPGGEAILIEGRTWIYAPSDPGGDSSFVRLGTDLSGVMLSPGPSVSSFVASPGFVAAENASTLAWNVDPSYTSVTISGGVGDVTGLTNGSGQGSTVVNPAETTTYTITATNAEGSNLRKVTVFVGFDPMAIRINEFLARPGDDDEVDEDGNVEDWIELYNPGSSGIGLGDYYLTDSASNLTKWEIPSVLLPAGGYLRIFASGLDRKGSISSMHTNFSLSGSGEYLALTKDLPSGGVEIISQFNPGFPSQIEGISYGYSSDGSQLGFLSNPTPRSGNGMPFDGFVEDTNFSVGRGFFTDPFSVVISSNTPGATIHYTTDGSTPTESKGTVYTGPIAITGTTILRAMAFRSGYQSTNVDTQSYFFPEDIRTQYANGSAPAGWPSGSVNGQVFNYGMDPNITGPVGAAAMVDALTAIPSLSLVTDLDNLVNATTGIYTHAGNHGKSWERPASLELVNPDGSVEQFQVECGVRIRGGASRSGGNPKHAFRFFFRSEYGDSKLEYPLFGTEGTTTFDKLDIRTAQNYSWSFKDGSGNQNTFLREVLGRDLQAQYGQPYTRSRYYHLYLNGVYWGLFMTQERVGADFGESYLGGDESDYDTVKSAGNSGGYNTEATDGSIVAGTSSNPGSDWAALYYLTRAQKTSPTLARYREMQGLNPDGTRNPELPVLLDVDNLIVYSMMIGYTGSYDGPLSSFVGASNNWYGLRDRNRDDRGFAFFVHDGEHSMGANEGGWSSHKDRMNTTNGAGSRNTYNKYNPGFVHRDLAESTEEYQLRFADIAHGALFNGGALTPESIHATINQRHDIVEKVIDAEAARWGDSKREPARSRNDWNLAVSQLRSIVDGRTAELFADLKEANLYPDITPPVFSTNLRRGEPGFPVYLRNEEGLIYYTLDGTDPRGENGLPSAGAVSANGAPIPMAVIDGDSIWRFLDNGTQFSASDVVEGHPSYGSSDWKHPDFNAGAWKSGDGPLGFGSVDGLNFDTAIGRNSQFTTYLRTEFDVANSGAVLSMLAQFVRDDAIIVYLNGKEALRSNYDPGEVVTATSGSSGASPESELYEVLIDPSLLVEGRNVLALELHNSSAGSNDLGISFDLTINLANSSTLITINDPVEIFSRSYDSASGEWSALNAGVFTPGGAPTPSNLLITEVNYHPANLTPAEEANPNVSDSEDFEFIEITNISTGYVDLGNLAFVQSQNGIEIEGMKFVFPLGTWIAPRSSLIIVRDLAAFPVRYPGVSSALIVGEYQGGLNNAGDRLILEDGDGNQIANFRYGDRAPWPSRADGDGSTLQLVSTSGNPDYQNAANWQASLVNGGTPGVSPGFGFNGDPNIDADGDGNPAFWEYFAGTSDTAAGSFDTPEAVVVEDGGERYAGIKFRKSSLIEGVGFEVQSTSGLDQAWSTSGILVSQNTLPDGRVEYVYRQPENLAASAKNFLRVRIFQN